MAAHSGHGWLPAYLPASARRVRVADPELGATLREAGAELVEADADAELVRSAAEVARAAPVVVVSLEEQPPTDRLRPMRACRRAARSLRLRARARAAARRLGDARTLLWEVDGPSALFPLRALVSTGEGETIVDAAAAAAGLDPGQVRPRIRQGGVVAFAADAVLRVAVGPSAAQVEEHARALREIAAAGPPPSVASRIPAQLGSGRAGLGVWSLESALPGTRPELPLSPRLLEDCSEFLASLYGLVPGGEPSGTPAADAAVLAVASPGRTAALERLGRWVERTIEEVPRGFGHGDFWRDNLLADGDRLVGVVDWASAGPGRLPLLDMLHLTTDATRARVRGHLGPVIASHLLPWARAGGDELARDHLRRVGVTASPVLLEALALAYWLDFVARQLRVFGDRGASETWVRQNVDVVVAAAE